MLLSPIPSPGVHSVNYRGGVIQPSPIDDIYGGSLLAPNANNISLVRMISHERVSNQDVVRNQIMPNQSGPRHQELERRIVAGSIIDHKGGLPNQSGPLSVLGLLSSSILDPALVSLSRGPIGGLPVETPRTVSMRIAEKNIVFGSTSTLNTAISGVSSGRILYPHIQPSISPADSSMTRSVSGGLIGGDNIHIVNNMIYPTIGHLLPISQLSSLKDPTTSIQSHTQLISASNARTLMVPYSSGYGRSAELMIGKPQVLGEVRNIYKVLTPHTMTSEIIRRPLDRLPIV